MKKKSKSTITDITKSHHGTPSQKFATTLSQIFLIMRIHHKFVRKFITTTENSSPTGVSRRLAIRFFSSDACFRHFDGSNAVKQPLQHHQTLMAISDSHLRLARLTHPTLPIHPSSIFAHPPYYSLAYLSSKIFLRYFVFYYVYLFIHHSI